MRENSQPKKDELVLTQKHQPKINKQPTPVNNHLIPLNFLESTLLHSSHIRLH